jgi:hypothetical protein
MTALCSTQQRDRIVAGLVAIVLLIFGLKIGAGNHSHLLPPGLRLDLGSVPVGQIVERKILVSNPSSNTIDVLRWAPTCHCMRTSFSQLEIPPHQSTCVSFETTGMRPLGARAATIAIQWRYAGEVFTRTDDVLVRAKYVSNISLSQERLDYGAVQLNETPVQSLDTGIGNGDKTWTSLDVSSDAKQLAIQVTQTSTGLTIRSQLNPQGLPDGVWKSAIKIFPVDNGKRTGEEIDVPVLARIQGPFKVTPAVVKLDGKPGQPFSFCLKVESQTEPMSELKFLGNTVQHPQITIHKDGKEAIITGILPQPGGKGVFVGKIPIQINGKAANVIRVSYIGDLG